MKTIIVLSSAIVLSFAANITLAKHGGYGQGDAQMQTTRTQARVDRLMERFDINQDGQIALDEVQSVRTTHFNQMDIDGNGLVNSEELDSYKTAKMAQNNSMQNKHRGKKGCHGSNKIERLDNDEDGQISASEFAANVPLFNRFDANEDGIITQEELSKRPNRR